MIKLSQVLSALEDIRKLTVSEIAEGEYDSAAEAFNAYSDRLACVRTRLAPIMDEVIEEFPISQPTVSQWLDSIESREEDIIWSTWEFVNPVDAWEYNA